eukprot:COSAG01_NODE_15618_length_1319_cov_1.255738_1_plen_257_part_00
MAALAAQLSTPAAGASQNAPTNESDDIGASEDGVLHLKSRLGTQQHWDDHYARERDNFAADEDDEGVDWFAENVGSRLLQWVEDNAQPGGSVLVLGCGSGVFLLDVEDRVDVGRALGVDYSPAGIALARAVGAKRGATSEFVEADITKLEALNERFDLVCDKGTFDAYMLGDGASVRAYATSVAAAVAPGGVFLLTSCNNTAEELVRHFIAASAETWGGDGGASPFAELDRVRYPTFQFGGVQGAAVATVAFRRAA